MDAATTEFEQGVMKQPEKQLEQTREQMEALYQNLRTIRHAINNNVAVIMAMAELTQRNPAQCQKLTQLCLDKAPQIAASIGAFTELFEGAVSLQEELDSRDATTTARA
jgi:two-component sensor histidine kinase